MTDRSTVLAVVILLGLLAILGLAGVVFLIDSGANPASVAVVSTLTGQASGALAALLVSTKSAPDPPPAP